MTACTVRLTHIAPGPIQQIPVVVPIFPTAVIDGVSPNPVTFTQLIQQPTFQNPDFAIPGAVLAGAPGQNAALSSAAQLGATGIQ